MQDTLIKTERMVLRPLRPSDAGLVSLYAGDERVAT
ncbi:MAG: GNAT family N-acetyltransferase, partial [Pseudomonadota bacterium]